MNRPPDSPKPSVFCTRCGGTDITWRGVLNGQRRFQCKRCGAFGNTGGTRRYRYSFTGCDDTAEITAETTKRIRTERDLIEALEIDTDTWQIEKFVVGKSEGYRKDRQVEWKVREGRVVSGDVHDTGKLLIEPLFSVRVWLRRRTKEIRAALATDDLKADLKRFAYRYKKIRYPKLAAGMLFEVEMPDIHLGKLTWAEESGENSDLKIQTRRVLDTIKNLLAYARYYPIERILIPIGNDFFNVDNLRNETTYGTPQQEDTRWRKTFRRGRILAVTMIDLCAAIAPVDVLLIPGNHDEERNFYLGDALECWYHTSPNVHIDNSAKKRKYYQYGSNLIGFTHGSSEKTARLPSLMPQEAAEMWAQTKHREWHTGDKHHKEDLISKTSEDAGIVIRVLRSLSPPDAWHYDKGFIGAMQASEGFLWDKGRGVIAQFTAAEI